MIVETKAPTKTKGEAQLVSYVSASSARAEASGPTVMQWPTSDDSRHPLSILWNGRTFLAKAKHGTASVTTPRVTCSHRETLNECSSDVTMPSTLQDSIRKTLRSTWFGSSWRNTETSKTQAISASSGVLQKSLRMQTAGRLLRNVSTHCLSKSKQTIQMCFRRANK